MALPTWGQKCFISEAESFEIPDFDLGHPVQVGGHFLLEASGKNDDFRAVRDLLELGSDANAKDAYSWTSLHLAAWNEHWRIATLLDTHRAEINAKTNYTGIGLQVNFNETMRDLTRASKIPIFFQLRNRY